VPWGTYFCFVSYKLVEQAEPGDTLIHTFSIPEWEYCQTRWFFFQGTVDGLESPSFTCIFEYHHPGAYIEQTEEQTIGIPWSSISGGSSYGQKLFIDDRLLSSLSFYLYRVGIPTGKVWYIIRRSSDDTSLFQEILMDSISISTIPTWYPLAIDPPLSLNEDVRLTAMATGGVAGNLVIISMSNIDVKPDEHAFWRHADGTYTERPTWDFMYRYTYLKYGYGPS